jgi:hypothetical protein
MAPSLPSAPVLNGPAGSTSVSIKWLSPAGTKLNIKLDYEFKIKYVYLEDVETNRDYLLANWNKVTSIIKKNYHNTLIPTCTINKILPGSSFIIKVRAKSEYGKGPWGNESLPLTSSHCQPDPVPIPIVEFVEERCIGVKWFRPPCRGDAVTMYELSHMVAGKSWRTMGNWKTELRTAAQFYCVPNLIPASTHSFRVRAYNSFGWGEFGTPSSSIKTKPSIPSPPDRPKLLSWDGEIVTIVWSHNPRDVYDNKKDNGSPLIKYEIQRLGTTNRDWENIGECRPQDNIFPYLEPRDSYTKKVEKGRKFRVRAINDIGPSEWSKGSEILSCKKIFPVPVGIENSKMGKKKKK